jgi:hypothetical protein
MFPVEGRSEFCPFWDALEPPPTDALNRRTGINEVSEAAAQEDLNLLRHTVPVNRKGAKNSE